MKAVATTVERIRWPEYLGCLLALRHSYGHRDGSIRCLDCRIDFQRAFTPRWRLVEWPLRALLAAFIGGPLAYGMWLLR